MRILLLTVLISFSALWAQETELRGTWFAWAGSNVPSKAEITETMEDLAAANFNVVYFDVWRYGYPYYQSELFETVTGISTDPYQLEGRDILMEAVAEAHRVGLQIEAWFEFGFVASVGGNDHIFEAHPEWFAKQQNGSTDFDNAFKWLSHCNSDAQQFLIGLCTEVARNYDVDGIELDRIRYPGLNCGYDSATVALYASEHAGAEPPTFTADAEWMSWRAEKLTEFMAVCYDSIKAVNPEIMVSNAPIVYPYGYSNFCQDWRPWINDGYLDNVAPQVYRATNASYVYDLDIQMGYVDNDDLLYPGISTIVNSGMVQVDEFLAMIQSTRDRGLNGHVIWYHLPVLASYTEALISGPYALSAAVPGRAENWRQPAIIVSETGPNVTFNGTWTTYSTKGFEGSAKYSLAEYAGSTASYAADIPTSGWYEVYVYMNVLWNAAQDAHLTLYHADGETTYRLDQTQNGHEQWYKIDDVFLEVGATQDIALISNDFEEGAFIFADAIMLLNTNRTGLTAPVSVQGSQAGNLPEKFELSCYPNPFNGSVNIRLKSGFNASSELNIFDVQGSLVRSLSRAQATEESVSWQWDGLDQSQNTLPSGVYILQVLDAHRPHSQKVMLLK